MQVPRCRQLKPLLQQNLSRGVVQEIGAAENICDASSGIVNNDGELIGVQAIAASQNEVTRLGGYVHANVAIEQVGTRD